MNLETTHHTPADMPADMAADATAGCPRCGSAHLRFRVHRTGVPHRPAQLRSLLFECRDCESVWTEPLTLPQPEPRAPLLG